VLLLYAAYVQEVGEWLGGGGVEGSKRERERKREHSPISDALYDVDVYVQVRICIYWLLGYFVSFLPPPARCCCCCILILRTGFLRYFHIPVPFDDLSTAAAIKRPLALLFFYQLHSVTLEFYLYFVVRAHPHPLRTDTHTHTSAHLSQEISVGFACHFSYL